MDEENGQSELQKTPTPDGFTSPSDTRAESRFHRLAKKDIKSIAATRRTR